MACETCGEPTKTVESDGGVESGHFKERVECINGHIGFVEGDTGADPESWNRYGAVFEDY